MATIDLDAARAARLEATGEQTTIVYKGKRFQVPTELSYQTAQSLTSNDLEGALKIWMGDRGGKAFLALDPSTQDLAALFEQAAKLQGANGAGESQASDDS